MSIAIEKRDPYTSGHQQRVAQLARAIMKELGHSKEQLEQLEMAAMLHDIGKISVPAETLNKPTKLSNAEFEIIKQHPEVASEILNGIDFEFPLSQIILQHHENIDGSGYPQGISGTNILLEARVLRVADVVEAISSHRPYRPALGLDKAKEVVQNFIS